MAKVPVITLAIQDNNEFTLDGSDTVWAAFYNGTAKTVRIECLDTNEEGFFSVKVRYVPKEYMVTPIKRQGESENENHKDSE